MSRSGKILIAVLVLVLLAVAIIFWGSIASGLCVLGLVLLPGALAYKKLWIDRENLDFDEMDPAELMYRRHMGISDQEDSDR